ncbi:MAG: ABC transporter permease [Chloroflexota bacterium]
MASAAPTIANRSSLPTRRGISLSGLGLLFSILLALVAFVVLYPILLLIINSFQVGIFGREMTWGLDNWRTGLAEPKIREAIFNTLGLTAVRQFISFALGVCLAWLFARTNLPGKNILEFGFWVAFFLPTLTVTLGWILIFDGERGLANKLLMNLPFVTGPVFDIYSWWGIVFVHLVTGTLASKVILLTPAFRNLDSSLEEASIASGASTFSTLFRIVVPVMAPALMIVMLLGTIRSLESFEVELILGAPHHIDVYSTLIYRQVQQQPPQYGNATVLSLVVLGLILPFVLAQQWITNKRSHATVTGKHAARLQNLGKWRWPIFALVLTLVIIVDIVPIVFIVMSTFMKLFGFFTVADPWTMRHWQEGLRDPGLLAALRNTLILGFGAAALSMVLYTLIAYMSVRTRFRGRGLLDFLTWLPTTLPGIVISLGFLWLFLGTPVFRPLYGTMWILIIAVTLSSMTVGVQIIKSNMVQLGAELEEASWASGGSWMYTLRRVVIPLVAPVVAVVGVLTFATAARATSVVALLSSRNIQPLSMVQLDHMSDGAFERASVIGVIILLLTTGVALVGRFIGGKSGIAGR